VVVVMREVTSEARQRSKLFSFFSLLRRIKPVYTGRLPLRLGLRFNVAGVEQEKRQEKNHIFSKAPQKCVIIESFADRSARQKETTSKSFLILKNLQPISVGV
jgi:hypothetical protein